MEHALLPHRRFFALFRPWLERVDFWLTAALARETTRRTPLVRECTFGSRSPTLRPYVILRHPTPCQLMGALRDATLPPRIPNTARGPNHSACAATRAAPPSARATSRRSSASTTSCRGWRRSTPVCASTRDMRSSWQAGCLHALLQPVADPAGRGSYHEGWPALGRIARPAPSSTRPRCRGSCTNTTAGH